MIAQNTLQSHSGAAPGLGEDLTSFNSPDGGGSDDEHSYGSQDAP